jgi:hypothetical protein
MTNKLPVKLAGLLAIILLGAQAGAESRGITIPGVMELPVTDGNLDDWALDQCRIPGTKSSEATGNFGDFYLAWLPEGLLVAITYTDTGQDTAPAGADSCRLTMGVMFNEERPVAFTLAGLQRKKEVRKPDSVYLDPPVKSVWGGTPFPTDGRFTVRQGRKGGQSIIEIFLPAQLFGREEIEQADAIRVYLSLKLKANLEELYWPMPFKTTDFWNTGNWASVVLGDIPGGEARRVKRVRAEPATETATPLEQPALTATALSQTAAASATTSPGLDWKLAMAIPKLKTPGFKPGGGRILAVDTELNKPARLTVIIYDRRNKIIHRFPEQDKKAGPCQITWNGTRSDGKLVQKGNYLMEIIATNGKEVASHTVKLGITGK